MALHPPPLPKAGGGSGFNPLRLLSGPAGGIPGLTGGAAGPSVSRISGDAFFSTGSFQVGEGNRASGGPGGRGFDAGSLIAVVAIGAVAWVVVSAVRK